MGGGGGLIQDDRQTEAIALTHGNMSLYTCQENRLQRSEAVQGDAYADQLPTRARWRRENHVAASDSRDS